MKKAKSILIILIMVSCILIPTQSWGNTINVIVDGDKLEEHVTARVINGVTYISMEILCEALDAEIVDLSTRAKEVYLIKRNKVDREMEIVRRNKSVKVNGITKIINFEPLGSVVFPNSDEVEIVVPLTFVVEQLGGEVVWDAATNTAIVTSYKPITFTDENLELEIRSLINIPEGDIFKSDVESVHELIIPGKDISEIEGLQYFKNLRRLVVSDNNIKDISPLISLENLSVLLLKGNPIDENLSVVHIYDQLIERDFDIKVSFNDENLKSAIRRASGRITGDIMIEDVMKITSLDISGEEVADITGIEYIRNLKELNLSDNKIRNIEPLKYLNNIEVLNLSSNRISNVEPLSYLTKLNDLDLRDNRIKKIEDLGELPNLSKLNISGNNIEDYEFLALYYPDLEDADFDIKFEQRFYIDSHFYYVNDVKKEMDTVPIIKEGRTFLPIRYVAEEIDAKVDWNQEEKSITISLDDKEIRLWINRDIAFVNNNLIEIEIAPFISDGRTLLPVRFVTESLGLGVKWDGSKKEVTVYLENEF